MGRQPCCDKVGLRRGAWTVEEDQKLISFILKTVNGSIPCWRLVPKLAGLLRCGKSCRLRWTNYLRPGLKRGDFSQAEEDQIIQLHSRLGNRWSKIASHFPGRTDNEIKNHWNTRIKKRLKLLGVNPAETTTHETIGVRPEESNQVIQYSSPPPLVEDESIENEDDPRAVGQFQVLEMPWEISLDNVEQERTTAGALLPSSSSSSSSSTSYSLDDSSLEGSRLFWFDTIDSFPSWEDIFSSGYFP